MPGRRTVHGEPRRTIHGGARGGFTLTEVLIVVGLLIVLVGLLLPALGGVWSTGQMTQSMSNLRQIGGWMQQYSVDHNDFIVPSRFDHRNDPYKGKVRSRLEDQYDGLGNPPGVAWTGTWADVLHTVFEVGAWPVVQDQFGYQFVAPDRRLYDLIGRDAIQNPFRSTADNGRNWSNRAGDEPPIPYGNGAQQTGYPGFFAANDFFNAGWQDAPPEEIRRVTNGQIRAPNRSMYLVDSYIGLTIDDSAAPFDSADGNGDGHPDWEVDFRYGGDVCLMLFLDGHAGQYTHWKDLVELEGSRRVRICDLDKALYSCLPP